jgi:O-antigen ligase
VRTLLAAAAGVAVLGLLDVYLIPLSFWRHARGWYVQQLGLTYHGLSGLPENFVYNSGNNHVFRRLTSTFLSPLATAYLLVVALLVLPYRRRLAAAFGALLFAGLLWTHTRAALAALVLGLVVLALLRRSFVPVAVAVLVGVVGFVFVKEYDHFAPRTHFTASEQRYQEQHAHQQPAVSNDASSANEASTREHLSSLRAGLRTAFHHPYGFGLGNAGVTAERTKVKVEAGESTYTELAVETGIAGALVFVAWSLLLLRRLFAAPPLAAAFAATLFLGLQTDVIGIPWIAVVVWALAGSYAYAVRGRAIQRPRPMSPVSS